MFMAICDNAETLSVVKMIKTIMTIIRIVVPLLLIISIAVGYTKNVKDGELEKTHKKTVTKSVAAVLIFLIPTFISVIMNLIWSDSDLTSCLNNATTEGILQARVNYTEKLISILENDFSYSNYTAAKESTKDIDDKSTKASLNAKIESYEQYIDLQSEIKKLNLNYDREKYKQLSGRVDQIQNENVKEKLKELLESIGGKFLNVAAGTYAGSNGSLSYKVFVPNDAKSNMPLIMYLHGDGGGEMTLISLAKQVYGENYPFIVVAPVGGMWAETPGRTANLKNIIDEVCNQYNCDTERISIGGHSRGAIGTWAMVNQYPNLFYSAVPVSCRGTINPYNFLHTKVRAFCGNQGDDINYYYSSMKSNVQNINNAGGRASFYELNAGHGGTPALSFTKSTFEWMIE